jgi:Uri superfamily endonuclease
MVIAPKPGTYGLVLFCASRAGIRVGRRGTMQLQPGYYVYLGSALGPGGLRARIAHHQKRSSRPHWHIDYLRAHTRLHSLWLNYDGTRHEHAWARAMQKMPDATIPFPRFGASDCRCPSHLFFFQACPALMGFFGEGCAICTVVARRRSGLLKSSSPSLFLAPWSLCGMGEKSRRP